MVTEFTVFGSCACRDIFFSEINTNYKDYFKIGEDGIRISLISLMQQKVPYDNESLKIYPETRDNINYSNWIKKDFDKTFLNVLKENNFEYLLLDTFYDVDYGIIELNDGTYITKNLGIEKTKFYKNLENKRILTLPTNTEEYYKLWTKHCNLFFEFLEENCPNTKVILNPNRHVCNILEPDGTVSFCDKFKKQCEIYNPYRNLLDEYIIKNFDVEVLFFNEKLLIDRNHYWGCFSLHYIPEYYTNMTQQLNNIIKRNKLNNPEFKYLNNELRQIKREYLLFKFESEYDDEFNELRNRLYSDQNEPKELLFEDKGIINNFNDNWSNTENFKRESKGTVFFKSNNKPIVSSVGKLIPQKCSVEFDIMDIEATNYDAFFWAIRDENHEYLTGYNTHQLGLDNGGHYKIKINNGKIYITSSSGRVATKEYNAPNGMLEFLFWLPDGLEEFTFRNLKIEK